MNEDILSSGFIGEDIPADKDVFTEIREFYVSPTGYSRLYQCRRHGKLHVLKCLQPLYIVQDLYDQLLQKEFNIGYQLEHSHICRTLGWEKNELLGNCILLEYIDGVTLKTFMEQGKLTRSLACKFITEICNALQYIHSKQIVHRDLKPSNILITHNGYNVKLIDFGLSDCDDYGILKLPAGTRKYLAPEQLTAPAGLDCRIDIYSLGVIIGEMADLLKDRQLAAIARKCTRENPNDRYSSALEIVEALKERGFRTVYKYAAIVAVLLAVSVWFLQYPFAANTFVGETTVSRVYTNLSVGTSEQNILLEERLRMSQHLDRFKTDPRQLTADSLRMQATLKKALNREYPTPELKHSPGYKRRLADLQAQAEKVVGEMRRGD